MMKARVDELAETLLQTDFDAIAANDDHVVFTVRVSREALRKNHYFLTLISDMAAGEDLPKRTAAKLASLPPSLSRKRLLPALALCVAGAAFFAGWILPTAPFMPSAHASAPQCRQPPAPASLIRPL